VSKGKEKKKEERGLKAGTRYKKMTRKIGIIEEAAQTRSKMRVRMSRWS
jgi:hypothetical protein